MTRLPLRLDAETYRILRGHPAAIALRQRAIEWDRASEADGVDHSEGCKHAKASERAHRAFLDAAVQFAEEVRKRSREHMHLWAMPGELVVLIPWTPSARAWLRANGIEGRVFMVKYWAENLTVRSPRDKRKRRTFGPREATWAKIESEAERVRFERSMRAA